MRTIELTEGVFWVGAVDWNCRDFHGYVTDKGATYNAYLVKDEKTALIDLVKAPFANELIERVRAVCPLEEIDYIILNHGEPDHSGAFDAIRAVAPQAKILTSPKGAETFQGYYGAAPEDLSIVKTGDSISLGRRSLQFITTPMLHWPDSMATYLPEEKILFSMDGFGQHLATSERFDDELDWATIHRELKRYYANILMPFGSVALKVLDQLAGLELRIVAPSHGLILRRHFAEAMDSYAKWARGETAPRVDVVYDTMWESTGLMARAIYEGALDAGAAATIKKVRANTLTDLATDALDAGALAVGSSTLNQGMMPAMAAYLTYILNLKPSARVGLAFGSYGWRGAAAGKMAVMMAKAGIEASDDPIEARWRPDDQTLTRCREAGGRMACRAIES